MFWLLKSEPEDYSWSQLIASGSGVWDGVRNYQAQRNLRAMRMGDRAFFYHTGTEKAIVGIVEIIKEFYPDPTDSSGKFVVVEVRPVKAALQPATLAQLKQCPELANLQILKQPRLSVAPITPEEWAYITNLLL